MRSYVAVALLAAFHLAGAGLLISAPQTASEKDNRAAAGPQGPDAEKENSQSRTQPASPGERTRLNLLGEVDVSAGEARRNENVRLTLIDNNVLKELYGRLGTTATVITEFRVDQGYFGAEFGEPPTPALHLAPSRLQGMHGSLFWSHNNSILSARSFFQVGDVQPARTNDYGFMFGVPLRNGAGLTVAASQRKLRGQVNGNVLVPAVDERTPLATDPEIRAIVQRILNAYPAQLPNRTDINPRALNTNAPQNIDNDRISGALDQPFGARDRLALRYGFVLQKVEAFQLVGGQNPDTTTRNHTARATWSRTWSPAATADLSLGFDRIGSLLVPEETSLGPFYLFSRELASIGPGGDIPIDRAQNMYRVAGAFRRRRGGHSLTAGFELLRRQVNGFESNEHRGVFRFGSDFGRDIVANLRMGTPTLFATALGSIHRGFRDSTLQFYAGDDWRLTSSLTLSLGLRYQPVTSPSEVNSLSRIPYSSDWNNLAPSLGLAARLPGNWGIVRAAYGLHYGEIFPATFVQLRFNPPGNINLSLQVPDLARPLKDLKPSDLDPNARSSIYRLASDLRTPYVHQYGFSWQWDLPRDWTLELGYTGSRSHKLLTMWYLNRARAVEGIPQITDTVNERRPDQRYYTVHHVHNGSRGYFDAAKITLGIPRWAGFTVDASYWFSKAIDLGANYTNTASGRDARTARSPSEFEFQKEMRGLSDFDQPHAMQWAVNYQSPGLAGLGAWARKVLGSWQVSSVLLLKSGTPFSVDAGSDGPDFGNVDGLSGDNPVLLDPGVLGRSIDHPDTAPQRLPRSAFGAIAPTELRGNLGRNTFRKDGVANVNLGLAKRWNIGGDKSLLFRAESLNLFNHPQFAEPGNDLTSLNFAQITNTLNDGRAFRFTLQFDF